MADDRGMDRNDWTSDMLKDADTIKLVGDRALYKIAGKWFGWSKGYKVTGRGFKHPADAYQRLCELLAK